MSKSTVSRLLNPVRAAIQKFPAVHSAYMALKDRIKGLRLKSKSPEEVFTEIYRRNSWGGAVSVSGPGSDPEQTRTLVSELPSLFSAYNITSITDIPCGDFSWMALVDRDGIRYTGADIVPELIRKNEDLYGSETVAFRTMNIISGPLPRTDLILCRDCLVHFSFDNIFASLETIRRSGSEYLLTTTFTDRPSNQDIVTGQWRPLNLQKPPFLLPPPLTLINENCTEGNGAFRDKSMALWKISDLKPVEN